MRVKKLVVLLVGALSLALAQASQVAALVDAGRFQEACET
jgi:hypothetical protein